MNNNYLDSMRRFEGFCALARPDGPQLSNGYGTRALFAGEVIGREEADARFRNAVDKAERLVEQCAPGLDEGTKAALTSLTFNTGVRWMQSGLGVAVRQHDFATAQDLFQRYTKAAGHTLPGLVSRRAEEVKWFGSAGATASGAPDGLRPAKEPGMPPTVGPKANTDGGGTIERAQPVDDLTAPFAALTAPLVRSIEFFWNQMRVSVNGVAEKPPGGPVA